MVSQANANADIKYFFNVGLSTSSTARWWTCANIVVNNAQQYETETGGSDNGAR